MELSSLNFKYGIKNKGFERIFYNFDVISEPASNEEITKLARSSLQNLEFILDKYYTEENFKKEKNGGITSSEVDLGYDYSSRERFKGLTSQLRYNISLNPQGEPKNLGLSLSNFDDDSNRILKVHDSIIALPDLEVSNRAQIQLDRIDYLRSDGFEVEKYLITQQQ